MVLCKLSSCFLSESFCHKVWLEKIPSNSVNTHTNIAKWNFFHLTKLKYRKPNRSRMRHFNAKPKLLNSNRNPLNFKSHSLGSTIQALDICFMLRKTDIYEFLPSQGYCSSLHSRHQSNTSHHILYPARPHPQIEWQLGMKCGQHALLTVIWYKPWAHWEYHG